MTNTYTLVFLKAPYHAWSHLMDDRQRDFVQTLAEAVTALSDDPREDGLSIDERLRFGIHACKVTKPIGGEYLEAWRRKAEKRNESLGTLVSVAVLRAVERMT